MPDEAEVNDGVRWATPEDLLCKKRAWREFEATLEPGTPPIRFRFEALSSLDYNRLMNKHAPTTEQRARGQAFNPDTFAPELLALVCVRPQVPLAQWRDEIFGSKDWSGGELSVLFDQALTLCGFGFDLTPIAAG